MYRERENSFIFILCVLNNFQIALEFLKAFLHWTFISLDSGLLTNLMTSH